MQIRSLRRAATLGWLGWRLFGPILAPRHRGPQERPPTLPGRTITIGRNEFLVREGGPADGPPLVLLHGWVYDSVATWHRVLDVLTARYRVVAIDQRNHGKSDRIQARYAIEQLADETAAILEAIGISRAAFVGYSMGGMVAQELASRHPGRVDRLVLAGTAAYPIPIRRLTARALFALGRAAARIGSVGGARVSHAYLMRVGAFERRYSRYLWETLLDRDVNLYFEGGASIWRFDARDRVRGITAPALVIIPTDDQLIPAVAQYELASLLPSVEVVELVGARHEAILTHADDIAKAIVRFVG